ncbi:hypothetical protein H6S07_16205 [Escherichia coli]|nr:hypothetical protein H6S07_16205 [Escherichia coli]
MASAPVIRVEQKLDKGIGFARFAKSLAAAKGVRSEALKWPVVSIRMTVVCIMS